MSRPSKYLVYSTLGASCYLGIILTTDGIGDFWLNFSIKAFIAILVLVIAYLVLMEIVKQFTEV